MANARQCDICGGYYLHHFGEINGIAYLYDVVGGGRYKTNAMDCCPDCITRFNALIDQIREEAVEKDGSQD